MNSATSEPAAPASARADVRVFAGLAALLLAALVSLDALRPGGRGFLVVTPENTDSICYFSVAHSLLFDRDVDLSNQLPRALAASPPAIRASRWIRPVAATGLPGSVYPIGYSLLGIAPLAVGTAIDGLSGGAADGFGPWAIRCFAAANIVWLVAGLYFLHSWLLDLGARWSPGDRQRDRLRERWTFLCGLALIPATALGYYAFTVMAHTASFMAASLFLRTWYRRRDSLRPLDWALVGAAGGAMALCRWSEVLLLSIPPLYELLRADPGATWRRRAWWTSRLLAIAAAGVAVTPQLLEWRTIYGSALLVPQGDGFLTWPPPWAFAVLFSSWNGLFFVTPATILGCAGLVRAAIEDRLVALPLLVAFAAEVALTGAQRLSWHGWAFAMRNLIGSLPLLAAGLLYLFLRAPRRRWLVAAGLAAGSLFTLLAAIQWRYELVPRNDRLTFEEAFTDKLRLPGALARDREMRQAIAGEADPARRAMALEEVLKRSGESRVLLTRLEAAARAAGDAARADEIARRLEAIRERRLY